MKHKLHQQLVKFVVVGVINTGIDLAVLNILIVATGQGKTGTLFKIFKGTSFIVASTNSYFMNKRWTFSGHGEKKHTVQLPQFFAVTIVGFFINIEAAGFVVNHIAPMAGLNNFWPSIAALAGTFFGLFWNFIGYKLFVFKTNKKKFLPPA